MRTAESTTGRGRGTVRIAAADLREVTITILCSVGTPGDVSVTVGESLVASNLAGVDSHGVMRVPRYVQSVLDGTVDPAGRSEIVQRHGSVACVDGHRGWGQPAAQLATDVALEIAHTQGAAAVTIRACNHIGRLGEYMERVSAAGMVGLAVCNSRATVAAHGGRTRVLGTNPISIAAPRGGQQPPLLVDFATSMSAEGKLSLARAAGASVPKGFIVDRDGEPTTDPAAYYSGGALLTFGGHKGFCLNLMIEVLGGILSGGGVSSAPSYDGGNGTLFLVLNIRAFLGSLVTFIDQIDALCDTVVASEPADGFSGVTLPGEPEQAARVLREQEGLDIPLELWQELRELARNTQGEGR